MGLFGREEPLVVVREYASVKQFNRDAQKLAKKGYRVKAQSERQGLLPPISRRYVVTYERA